ETRKAGRQGFETPGDHKNMKNFCSHDSNLSEMTEIKEGASSAGINREVEGRAPASPPTGVAGAPPSTALSKASVPTRGWILYDGECRYCIAAAKRFARLFSRRGFHFLPLQTPWIQNRLGIVPGTTLEEMRVLTKEGEDLGGADAIIFLARQICWAWLFYACSK